MLVRLYSTLRGASGVGQVDVILPADARVSSVLAAALAQEPQIGGVLLTGAGQLRQDLLILRNGRNIRLLQGMDTALAADDRLDLFPLTGAQRAFAAG